MPRSTVLTWLPSDHELACLELPFLDLLRQLDSADRDHRIFESFEPEHRADPVFHAPMILFDQVIQVLAGSRS